MSRICEKNVTTQKKCYFTGQKILIMKYTYFSLNAIVTHTALLRSVLQVAIFSFYHNTDQKKKKNETGNKMVYIIKIFHFLSYDVVLAFARVIVLNILRTPFPIIPKMNLMPQKQL